MEEVNTTASTKAQELKVPEDATVPAMSNDDLADKSLESLLAEDDVDASTSPIAPTSNEIKKPAITVIAADGMSVPVKENPFPLLDDGSALAPMLDIAEDDDEVS